MNHNGYLKIGIIVLVVALIGAVAYIAWPKKTVAPNSKEVPGGGAASSTTTQIFHGVYRAWFEGWDILTYEFSYPPENVSVSSTPDAASLALRDIKSGQEMDIKISYEGARGYSPDDYFQNEVKPKCSACREVERPVKIAGAKAYVSENEEWVIVPMGFTLFVARMPVLTENFERILSTLRVIDAQNSVAGPPPQDMNNE